MQLSDKGITDALVDERIRISPAPTMKQIQPASVDLRLGTSFRFLGSEDEFGEAVITTYPVVLRPLTFVLACTKEKITLSNRIAGQVKGKSTRARQGLMVECAGFVDPGFSGQLTLEVFNFGRKPYSLTPGMLIAQIAFYVLDQEATRVYGDPDLSSHYQGQHGATPARVQ